MLNVGAVLDALGIDYSERSSEGLGLCPMHERRTGSADHSPSWSINLDSGMHICFSCGYKGNLVQLVCDVNEFYTSVWGHIDGYDYPAGQAWISSVAEIPIEKLMDMVRSMPTYIESIPKPLEMSEARLAIFVEPPESALEGRSLTASAAKSYGVLWDAKRSSWVLPLRDPESSALLGWQEKGTLARTFMNRPTGLKKSKTLFGVENLDEHTAIVVESPLDAVRIASAGFHGAVASCGALISEEQIKLLRVADRVIAAFDNPKIDAAGKKASEQMCEFARKYGINLSFFNYGDSGKKDPGDLTNEEIIWGIQNAKTSLLGEKAYV